MAEGSAVVLSTGATVDSVALADESDENKAAVVAIDTVCVLAISGEPDDACVELPTEPNFTKALSTENSVVFPTEERVLVVVSGLTEVAAVLIATLDVAEVKVCDINDSSCLLVAPAPCVLIDSGGLSKAVVAEAATSADATSEDADGGTFLVVVDVFADNISAEVDISTTGVVDTLPESTSATLL